MNIGDLGEMDRPAPLFGGPYSNLQALRALVALGFPAARIICTGCWPSEEVLRRAALAKSTAVGHKLAS